MDVKGYCVGCKKKDMKIEGFKIIRIGNRIMAKGFCSGGCKKKDGSKMPMCVFLNKEKAEKAANGSKIIVQKPKPKKTKKKTKKEAKKKNKSNDKKEVEKDSSDSESENEN